MVADPLAAGVTDDARDWLELILKSAAAWPLKSCVGSAVP